MPYQRQYPRYACHLNVDILSNDCSTLSCIAQDISAGGVFLIVPIAAVAALIHAGVNIESQAAIKIALPNHDQSQISIFNATVAHVTTVDNVELMIGLFFNDNPAESSGFITNLISKLH